MDGAQKALHPRFVSGHVAIALKDTPVVLVDGPRQCGKTTLARDQVAGRRQYVTLDDDTMLAAARGNAFAMGIVLYDGELAVSFGKRLFAVPISSLWW